MRYTFKFIDPLITSLEKRFKLYFDLSPEVDEAILAPCFHPTFKLRWIPEHDENMKNRVKNLCINIAEKYIENSSHTESSVDNVDDEDFLIFSSQEQCFDSRANLKVVQFFNNKNKALTCLDSYPTIKKLFIRYNTSLPSSAAVERLFSFAGFIQIEVIYRTLISKNIFIFTVPKGQTQKKKKLKILRGLLTFQ